MVAREHMAFRSQAVVESLPDAPGRDGTFDHAFQRKVNAWEQGFNGKRERDASTTGPMAALGHLRTLGCAAWKGPLPLMSGPVARRLSNARFEPKLPIAFALIDMDLHRFPVTLECTHIAHATL